MPHMSLLEKDGESVPWLFRDSVLFRSRRNAVEAKQLAAKHMVIPEEIGEQVIPQQQVAEIIHGAQKFSQIGGDAAEKLIRSAVDTQLYNSCRMMVILANPTIFIFSPPHFQQGTLFQTSFEFLLPSYCYYILRKVWNLDRTPV